MLDPDSEETLTVSGFVRTGSGAPVPAASVHMTHSAGPRQEVVIERDTTTSTGAFQLVARAPEGYAYPNCATMAVHASANGFETFTRLSWSEKCTSGVRRIEGLILTLYMEEASP